MAKPDKDAHVFSHIEALVAEAHRLFERGELDGQQKKRLAEVQSELDRYWISCASAARCASSATILRRRGSAAPRR